MAGKAPERRAAHPQVTEEVFANLAKVIREKGFKTPGEAQVYLNKVLKASGGKPPEPNERTPLEQAQAVMYRAYDSPSKVERLKLASQALRLSPDCSDAYFMMALEGGGPPEEQIKLYEAAVQAGERALGKVHFEKHVGDFWSMVQTRPYMRARFQLARCLWWLNRRGEAVEHAVELLRLNKDDNQGVRYFLLGCYAMLGRMDEVEALLNRSPFKSEVSPYWTYSKALVLFGKEGASPAASRALAKAVKWNKHVPAFLLGEKALPRENPEMIAMGEESAATAYVSAFKFMWDKTPGALDWLRKRTQAA